jgi:hypothetical protein
VVEFKKAENNFDFDDLGKYFSALSNEANLFFRARPEVASDLCLAVSESAVPASLLVWYISCLYTKNVPLGTLFTSLIKGYTGICEIRPKAGHYSLKSISPE